MITQIKKTKIIKEIDKNIIQKDLNESTCNQCVICFDLN